MTDVTESSSGAEPLPARRWYQRYSSREWALLLFLGWLSGCLLVQQGGRGLLWEITPYLFGLMLITTLVLRPLSWSVGWRPATGITCVGLSAYFVGSTSYLRDALVIAVTSALTALL